MNDHFQIKIYGNTDLSDGTDECPLVTFALFSYNQEKYIREAVSSAFSQTYSPLEIVFSDDCSNDRTFEIIEEMSKNYRGPHRLIVRRNTVNQGVFPHVYDVSASAAGGLVVLAAGDDISFPSRTSILVKHWQATNAMGLFSAFNLVDEEGALLLANQRGAGDSEVKHWFSVGQKSFIHGATSAYSRTIFERLPKPKSEIFNEDSVLTSFILLSRGHIEFVAGSLVAYRRNPEALSNTGKSETSFNNIVAFEQKISRAAKGYCNLCDYVSELTHLADKPEYEKAIILDRVATTRRFAQIRKGVASSSFKTRLTALLACKNLREFRYVLPRLMGIQTFALIKVWLTK